MPSEPSGNLVPSLQHQTDAELVLALRTGQKAALGILYDRHAGLVYGLALKALGNAPEAEDLTQDIFLTLAKGSAYDPARGTLRTFLAILTRSRSLDRLRSRRSTQQVMTRWQEREQSAPPTNIPLEQAFQSEQSQEVQAALAQLAADEQQILKLAYYDGLSQSQIAQQLELPLGTVKTKARRGLLKLRQSLTPVTE